MTPLPESVWDSVLVVWAIAAIVTYVVWLTVNGRKPRGGSGA